MGIGITRVVVSSRDPVSQEKCGRPESRVQLDAISKFFRLDLVAQVAVSC